MINFRDVIPQELFAKSISLEKMGVNSIAWKKEDALEVVKVLSGKNYIILGVDALSVAGEEITYTYDNCPTDNKLKKLTEWSEKVRISAAISSKYISRYREGKRTVLYLLVVADFPEE